MRSTTRRAALIGLAGAATATVAAAALLRKPQPEIITVAGPAPAPAVELRGLDAFVPTDPAKDLPVLSFTDAAGAQHGLAEFTGRIVVLNLWATWCVPCVAEMPALAALARAGRDKSIAVVPLAYDQPAKVAAFFKDHDLSGLSTFLDPKGTAARTLGARGLPTTILIDRAGRERARLEGGADWAAPNAIETLMRLAA